MTMGHASQNFTIFGKSPNLRKKTNLSVEGHEKLLQPCFEEQTQLSYSTPKDLLNALEADSKVSCL
jgi:hypothetical protein